MSAAIRSSTIWPTAIGAAAKPSPAGRDPATLGSTVREPGRREPGRREGGETAGEPAWVTLLLLGGHGSTEAARATVERSVRAHVGPVGSVRVVSWGGPEAVSSGGTAWWADGIPVDGAADADDSSGGDAGGELSADSWRALVAGLDARFAAAALENGLGSRPLVVAGFSQGGAAALAWACAPERATAIAGVVSVAGFLPSCVTPIAAPPTLIIVTEDDEVVDPFLGRRAARLLRNAGTDVTVCPVDAGHEWTDAASAALAAWLPRLG